MARRVVIGSSYLSEAHHMVCACHGGLGAGSREGPRLRLITWNIGYAELEDDSRAQYNND